MSLAQLKVAALSSALRIQEHHSRALATTLTTAVVAYVIWKIVQSPEQALQFAFNGLPVGAVYALLALGFTLVYSTVWFFDLYYGAAAALGAYGVFYLRSQDFLGGRYDVNSHFVNIVFAAVVAGVVAWALHENFHSRLRSRFRPKVLLALGALPTGAVGVYMWLVLANPSSLNALLSPVIGVSVAAVAFWALQRAHRRLSFGRGRSAIVALVPAAAALGAYCGFLVAVTPESKLYLGWGVSCLLAGAVSLALYRGLYVYMRLRAKSPLIMLVASLGILLAITAIITIIFRAAPRPLPEAFGSDVWTIAGANIKGFNVFAIGVALAGFAGLLVLLKRTAFGTAVRAIGDDEEVSKVVGINTTVVVAVVFFIGAMFAALAGILSGHDTAIQPRMGLLLLLKGWIASVIGGIGNLHGAIIGGFALGMIEQFGIWDLAGEWKDVISFVVLIVFLSFWPQGLLPRR
ncbi:MAG: branched-chain amino acid ABC transporter permease [Chloroflexi bacterium]|nr:branched-chain amino acid ABC transporter permease [Chloroflexota bacterium]